MKNWPALRRSILPFFEVLIIPRARTTSPRSAHRFRNERLREDKAVRVSNLVLAARVVLSHGEKDGGLGWWQSRIR
jgi:hypothetical protein